jgi:hypothetical protein
MHFSGNVNEEHRDGAIEQNSDGLDAMSKTITVTSNTKETTTQLKVKGTILAAK